MSKEHFKKTIEKLVETFERNKDVYRSRESDFNEAQLREQFLNPMLSALGWDMSNEQGYAEQYKEVVHEAKVYVKGKPKAPDYSFRVGGQRKFFLEAKQPFVRIKSDFDPALQLRRYAWSAHLPISILTDFEEFAIYDTTLEPKSEDNASTGRIEYFTFDQYTEKWEGIYDLFAKDSILMGSFDKYAAKEKKGKQVVDKVFLSELEKWREWLAKDIAKHNASLSVNELNFAVQKLIDRIIFLRIAEDRGIEQYKSLQQVISNTNSYPELIRYFKRAHDKYNSSLFDFKSDTLTPKLTVSDQVLDKILANLYYPKSPYEFSVLGVELLGSIYEQFLGKVIRLTDGHNAKVEDKPEVKKAGGVFYTPQYIVEYIVQNTVGELIKDKTPKQIEKIKVLDPACGSGSFLIGAYEYILNWHLDYYSSLSDANKKKLQKKGVIYMLETIEPSGDKTKNWYLTTEEKKKIMLNNIYGVDIDSQAVEVTKLSLALKMLENENQETISMQMKLFPDRILPDLSSNIKCGNSLVGSDYWYDKNLSEVTDAEIKKVNAFDWHVEFKQIIDAGGFDAVIGNPPYVRVQFLPHKTIDYLKNKFLIAWRRIDISILFFEVGLNLLWKKGKLGFITSNQFETVEYGRQLRRLISSEQIIRKIVNYRDLPIFQGALTYVSTYILEKSNNSEFEYYEPKSISDAEDVSSYSFSSIGYSNLTEESWLIKNGDETKLFNKLVSQKTVLSDIGHCWTGLFTGKDHLLMFDADEIENHSFETEILLPVMRAQDIDRYVANKASKYVIFTYKEENDRTVVLDESELRDKYPITYQYLHENKKDLESRKDSRKTFKDRADWYGLTRFGRYEVFRKRKILSPGEVKTNRFGIDNQVRGFSTARVFAITLKDDTNIELITALLNTKLIEYYLHSICPLKQGGYYTYSSKFINSIPIPESLLSDTEGKRQLADIANQLVSNATLLTTEKADSKKNIIKSRIKEFEEIVDKLAYELYRLTQDEIDVIESAS